MRLRPMSVFLLAVLLVTTSSANKLNAQTTTSGGLTGVVTDPSHAVVRDAGVEIKDDAKGATQSTKTDREGVYGFFFLAPGRYALTVTHAGFQKESRTVNVLLGPPVSVNATLQVAKASTSVSVTAEAPLIQAENGDVSTTMNEKQVSEIPNPGNDLTYIAQIAPGAIMNTDTSNTYGNSIGNFSILGMPGASYHYTLDGMTDNENGNNGVLGGALGLALGLNQVQEATVVSTGYSGQFGECRWRQHQLHHEVRQQQIPRQRRILLERSRLECQRLVQQCVRTCATFRHRQPVGGVSRRAHSKKQAVLLP